MAQGSDYLSEILQGQNQRKVSGQGALTGSQVEAAFKGTIAARSQDESSHQALLERSAAEQTRSKEAEENMAFRQEQYETQKNLGQQQTAISGVSAALQTGILAYKLFGTPSTTTPSGSTLTTGAPSTYAEGTPAFVADKSLVAGTTAAEQAATAAVAESTAATGLTTGAESLTAETAITAASEEGLADIITSYGTYVLEALGAASLVVPE
jgi:hypothetical protein